MKLQVSTSEGRDAVVYKAKIIITLRPSILDPQGKAVQHALGSLGMSGISGVRIGKFVEMTIPGGTRTEAEHLTAEACRKLLANPVMEDVTFTIEEQS